MHALRRGVIFVTFSPQFVTKPEQLLSLFLKGDLKIQNIETEICYAMVVTLISVNMLDKYTLK